MVVQRRRPARTIDDADHTTAGPSALRRPRRALPAPGARGSNQTTTKRAAAREDDGAPRAPARTCCSSRRPRRRRSRAWTPPRGSYSLVLKRQILMGTSSLGLIRPSLEASATSHHPTVTHRCEGSRYSCATSSLDPASATSARAQPDRTGNTSVCHRHHHHCHHRRHRHHRSSWTRSASVVRDVMFNDTHLRRLPPKDHRSASVSFVSSR